LRNRLLASDRDIAVPPGHALSEEEAAAGWEAVRGDKLQWLGHSAFRWQIGGTVMLSDPLLTARASPFVWAGPRRFVRSPLAPEEAEANLLLITHCHYDHLDLRTLMRLPHRQRLHAVVPMGLARLVRSAGIHQVTELDWHESAVIEGIDLTLLPAVHFSARTLWDRNCTLWGGFAVRHGGCHVYLSGDTAWHPTLFEEIGKRHGPFSHGLVPIGAYEPRSIMIEHHATPEEAVAIGQAVGARVLVGHHWGALRLTTEDPFEPPSRFLASARAKRPAEEVWVMKVGETRALQPAASLAAPNA
jgi:N-acyl-phosphatidylethanolamine-hydrolysing phospholipase D